MHRMIAVVTLAALALTGCYRWTSTDPLRPELRGDSRELRIVWEDSTHVTLRDARVEGDSLIGWAKGTDADLRGHRRSVYALPLTAAARVELREIDTGKTLGVVLPIVGGLVGVVILCAVDDSDFTC